MAVASAKPTGVNVPAQNPSRKQKSSQQCPGGPIATQITRQPSTQDQELLPQEPRPQMRASRPRPLELTSQPSLESLCSDIITPKEQLFRFDKEPSGSFLEEGPPLLLPPAQKRVRPPKPSIRGGLEEDPRSEGPTRVLSAAELGAKGRVPSGRDKPPLPKARQGRPPMIRNPYLARAADDSHSHALPASQPCLNRSCGSRFNWEYKKEVELGHGNFSRVFRAVHCLTGAAFAIKTNRTPIATPQARSMWLNEMQALAAVQPHPNIVTLYDAWFEPDGDTRCGNAEQAYLKLELCAESLGDVFKRRALLIREVEVLDMLRQMASALKRIHELGMVHLDIKPDNIYLAAPTVAAAAASSGGGASSPAAGGGAGGGPDGGGGAVYKLGDFGLAMIQGGGPRVGTSEGDCRYLAPEALKCPDFLTSGLADRLDIFALGASAYELLRGSELPKNGQPYHDIRSGRLVLPGVSPRLFTLIKKMMSPNPADRPTAEQLLKSSVLNGPGSHRHHYHSHHLHHYYTAPPLPTSVLPRLRSGLGGSPGHPVVARKAKSPPPATHAATLPSGPRPVGGKQSKSQHAPHQQQHQQQRL